jgi:hypothetical protein
VAVAGVTGWASRSSATRTSASDARPSTAARTAAARTSAAARAAAADARPSTAARTAAARTSAAARAAAADARPSTATARTSTAARTSSAAGATVPVSRREVSERHQEAVRTRVPVAARRHDVDRAVDRGGVARRRHIRMYRGNRRRAGRIDVGSRRGTSAPARGTAAVRTGPVRAGPVRVLSAGAGRLAAQRGITGDRVPRAVHDVGDPTLARRRHPCDHHQEDREDAGRDGGSPARGLLGGRFRPPVGRLGCPAYPLGHVDSECRPSPARPQSPKWFDPRAFRTAFSTRSGDNGRSK